jgi:hypothetical protein
MRALIVAGMLALASLASQTTPTSAQRWCGSLACQCRVQCGVGGPNSHIGASAAVQACTQKCVAAKKAAQR